jgi:thioredoxin reductase
MASNSADRDPAAIHDVAIVGGGPAGLSAALLLGRCCRSVLLCDAHRPRNAPSGSLNGFLTRDGIRPAELRRLGRAELRRYESVVVRDGEVTDVVRESGHFVLLLADGSRAAARKLLLATGVVDELPAIAGLAPLWGTSVFPCPYCDGWELRGRRLGVLGRGDHALALCRALTTWTDDLVFFSNGPLGLEPADRRALEALGVRLEAEPLEALEAEDGRLRRVRLRTGAAVERDALFLTHRQRQRSRLVERLGCRVGPEGRVGTEGYGATDVPGVYVAGDASEGVQFAIVAAAEGAMVGFEINRALLRERFSEVRAAVERE